jgi:tetratricopeptide (TPR) repeat protein
MIDSIDERISVQDKNLWLTDYEKQYGLSLENYLNIARYRNDEQIGDLGFAYTTLKKCLHLNPKNEEALGMMARVSRDMDLRDERCRVLGTLSELYPDDVEVISTYATALVETYRREGSIINPQEMKDAVELLRRCVQLTEGREERYHIMLALILTGAERFTEAAEVYKDLLKFQKQGGTTSDILPEAMLDYRIGDNYYNADNLQVAEEYLKRAKQLDPGNVEASIMLNKISLKKRGIR